MNKSFDNQLCFFECREHMKRPYLIILFLLQEDVLQHLASLCVGGLVVKHPGLDDLLVHVQFVSRGRLNPFLHTVDRHQTQHAHLVLLTDTMRTILSLQVLNTQKTCITGFNIFGPTN